jgi:aryl-alcohol dehydrogenase (NADP+)
LAKALATSEREHTARFDCVQPRYNLLHRDIEADLLPLCRDEGVGVIVFNPLAGGLLTGKHAPGGEPDPRGRFGDALGTTATTYRRRYWNEEALSAIQTLKGALEKRGKVLTTAVVAWVLRQPGVTSAIVGASRPEQLEATLGAPDLELDAEELALLDDVWFALPRQRPAEGPVR